jgi:iron(III) transport system substrate-binding protein
LQAVLDGAKKEAGQGTFVIWISSPKLEGTHKELMQAFQKRFELPDFAWEWVPGNSPDQNRRVLAESKTGRFSADVLSGSWAESIALAEANLLEEVAWVDVFGEALPTIREPANRIQVPELHNRMLAMWDTAKVMMFNTEQVKEADVPNTLEGLAEPKWAGRVVLDSNGAVLDILTLKLGREQIVSHTQAILPNRPILTRGSPAAITAIQTGQGAISPGPQAARPADRLETAHLRHTGPGAGDVLRARGLPSQSGQAVRRLDGDRRHGDPGEARVDGTTL